MPTTPVLALPYPAASDTADVPRDIQALATKLDPLAMLAPAAAVAVIARDRLQAAGTTFGPAWGDLGLINRSITFDGSEFLEVNGVWRTGANASATIHIALAMDGAPGTGTVVAIGTVQGVLSGSYYSVPLFGWTKPAAGSHTFRLYGFTAAGAVGNCDATQPSTLAWYRRGA